MNRKTAYFALFIFMSVLFGACAKKRNNYTVGSSVNPLILAFSAPYGRHITGAEMEKLAAALSSETSLAVKPKYYTDSVSLINDIGFEKADMAFMTLDEYLVAREEYKVRPVLRILRRGKEKEYRGIVAAGKEIKSLSDLEGKKVAVTTPYSIAGFILPSILFQEDGVNFEPVFTGSYDASLEQLKKGKVAAAAFYEGILGKEPKLRVVAYSNFVPNEPLVCRKRLPGNLCEKVASSLMRLSKDRGISRIFAKMADISGFEKVDASVYKGIHNLILESGKDIYGIVPDGAEIRKISEGYFID